MISTKFIVSSVNDVPVEWIFETYCQISDSLVGQDVKIKSLFNSRDTVPSMVIFFKNGTYYFKDFSTDIGGTGVDLVMALFNLNVGEAINKIINDYKEYLSNTSNPLVIKELTKKVIYKLDSFVVRKWNKGDADYWLSFGIDSDILERYNIKPLKSFTFNKVEDGIQSFFTTEKQYVYGYFRNDGVLYKIYQPFNKEKKFMKISQYLQGLEQLEYNKPILIIASSLKDGMSMLKLNLPVEFIAPDSEGTILHKEIIDKLKSKYKYIFTLLDNDTAGLNAMEKYKDVYEIESILLPLSKDISDSIKDYGQIKTRDEIIKRIKMQIK